MTLFSGFLGLVVGIVLGAWATWAGAQSAAKCWRNRALEAERMRDVFKAAADERAAILAHFLDGDCEFCAKTKDEWPDEISA